jgi:hypothetical protein
VVSLSNQAVRGVEEAEEPEQAKSLDFARDERVERSETRDIPWLWLAMGMGAVGIHYLSARLLRQQARKKAVEEWKVLADLFGRRLEGDDDDAHRIAVKNLAFGLQEAPEAIRPKIAEYLENFLKRNASTEAREMAQAALSWYHPKTRFPFSRSEARQKRVGRQARKGKEGADRSGREKGERFLRIRKKHIEPLKKVSAPQKVESHAQMGRETDRRFEFDRTQPDRQAVQINGYQVPISDNRVGFSAAREGEPDSIGIQSREKRIGGSRINVGFGFEPFTPSVNTQANNGVRGFFVDFIGKGDGLRHLMAGSIPTRMALKSWGLGTGMPMGGPYFLVISASILAIFLADLIGNTLPRATKMYGYFPPNLRTIIVKLRRIHASLSVPIFVFAIEAPVTLFLRFQGPHSGQTIAEEDAGVNINNIDIYFHQLSNHVMKSFGFKRTCHVKQRN